MNYLSFNSIKKVGVSNGGIRKGTNVIRPPFTQFSSKANITDTFKDFPNSLMSVGKTSEDDTASVFNKDGVTVHYEEDVLLTCEGKPTLISI